ncbi:MAG: A/G-specific adenine glycosylase [Solobacterium sp.]|nr:A/G-specific adenine glycosylase [Solobacterium sp.]
MNILTREHASLLVSWYEKNKRDLPWRKTRDPYAVWLSEIMLQQTRIEAATDYYLRFLDALPTIRDLAECPEEKLLKLWQGLGYYQRARNLQKCARAIISSGEETLPASYEQLLALPGIGPYTAGAVSAIAFGIPAPAVDGNVLRVLARLFADTADIRAEQTEHKAADTIASFYTEHPDLSADPSFVSSFTQGLMELGALVCIPNGVPRCCECPWKTVCSAHRQNLTASIPVRSKGKERKQIPMTVLVIEDGTHVLLHKRDDHGLLAGLYELPHVDGYPDPQSAVTDLLRLGYDDIRITPLPGHTHIFTHLEWHMKAFKVSVPALPQCLPEGCTAVKYAELDRYAVPGAFASYLDGIGKETI